MRKFQQGASYVSGPLKGDPNPYAWQFGQGMGIAPNVMEQRALSSANVLRNLQTPNLEPNINYDALEKRFPFAEQSITDKQTSRPLFGGINHKALVGFTAANTLLSYLGSRNENADDEEYVRQNLNNPYAGILPSNNGRSDRVKYGYQNYQDGGEVDRDPLDDIFDELEEEALKDPEKVKPVTESQVEEAQAEADEDAAKKQFGFQLAMESFRRQAELDGYEQETYGNFIKGSPAMDIRPNAGALQQAHQYYQSKGIPAHVSAGILGNLMQESNLNPNAVGDGGQARGIAQWYPDRYRGLQSFAAKTGRAPNDLTAQLDYILQEPGESQRVLSKLMQTSSPEEAAVVFSGTYERPNRKFARNDKRAGYAASIFNLR